MRKRPLGQKKKKNWELGCPHLSLQQKKIRKITANVPNHRKIQPAVYLGLALGSYETGLHIIF